MTFEKAKFWRINFGQYAGQTVDVIAETDTGLRYLDWLVDQPWVRAMTREALGVYLSDPTIQAELEDLVG